MTHANLQSILDALSRAEQKTKGTLTREECWAAVALARELQAPQHVIEYFAARANAA
jgi:hypothetical protein